MRDWEYQHKLENKLYIHHFSMIYVFLQFKMTVKVYMALIFQRDAVIRCPSRFHHSDVLFQNVDIM